MTVRYIIQTTAKPVTPTTCPACDAAFDCRAESGPQGCWCQDYPAIMPAGFARDCLCPACLAQAITGQIDAALKTRSHAQQLEMAARVPHPDKLLEHIDYTLEGGNYVFSRWYHLKRGSCCGNGCRNCPYPESVL